MTEDMIKCLIALADLSHEGEHFVPFNPICDQTELPRKVVRRHVRAMARRGLAIYAKGLWTEDGEPAGSGYAITCLGMVEADKHRPSLEGFFAERIA